MPQALRSRACQQCRDRRVKCDETPETCQQCRRLSLQCSGPIQGSVIIDMTDRVAKPRQKKKRQITKAIIKCEDEPSQEELTKKSIVHRAVPESPETPTVIQGILPPDWKPAKSHVESVSNERTELEIEEAIAAIRYQYKLPQMHQPSRAIPDCLDRAFISHFVQLNQGIRPFNPEIPWITHLPNMHERATKPALRLSIRAASMAFYATRHRDPTILVDSFRWYTQSLNCQRQSLARLGFNEIPPTEEILVPIILSLYEVWAGTTTTSLWHHLSAATKIIEMRGPVNCTGIAFPMFKAMRVSDAHKATVFNRPSIFASQEWMTIPFQGQERNAHQCLADILLLIPDCIGLCNMGGSLQTFFNTAVPSGTDLYPAQKRAQHLLHEVDNWAARFPHLTRITVGGQVVTSDMSNLAPSEVRQNSPDATLRLPDSFIALTAATYESVRLILSLLLHKITPESAKSSATALNLSNSSPGSPCPNLHHVAQMSAMAILNIASHIESTHPVGFDFMRSVFPVVVVALLGPRLEIQRSAQQTLERWGKKRGMKGLCAAWLNV